MKHRSDHGPVFNDLFGEFVAVCVFAGCSEREHEILRSACDQRVEEQPFVIAADPHRYNLGGGAEGVDLRRLV
jgi:hypothetical protein